MAAEPISDDHPPGPNGTTRDSVAAQTPTAGGRRRGAIRVVVVDDHAAVRLGLNAAIPSRAGLVCVGAVPDGELLPALRRRIKAALVGGVDAMVHKCAPALELFTAIEAVADDKKALPAPVPELAQAAAATLEPADPPSRVATQLNLGPTELVDRVQRMPERLTHRAG